MTNFNVNSLREILEKLYCQCNFRDIILNDPIEFPHRYKDTLDIEIAGFIASSFAYGRIDLFKPIIQKILNTMGVSPYDFLVNFDYEKQGKYFANIHYRFSNNKDIVSFLIALHKIIRKFKTLENLFKSNYRDTDIDISNALSNLVKTFYNFDIQLIDTNSPGFRFLLPDPQKNSPCKRLNLFLRWMIRDKDIDFGIWKGIPPNKLIIPLDTHIGRISRCLGLTERKSDDWKTAVDITNSLILLDPEDPIKYDLPLCHYGVNKLCNIKACKDCRLIDSHNT